MKISELDVNQNKINLTGTIESLGEIREFEKFGKAGKVREATLKDESGTIKVALWNEQADSVEEGDKIQISNGYVKEWQGKKQLSTGKYGKLEVIE